MLTNIYVDGFNLYKCSLEGTPYKWLDLLKLSSRMFQGDVINRIRYFTARVSDSPSDPDISQRQQVYLRALNTIPNLSIHYGQFTTHDEWKPLTNQFPAGTTPTWNIGSNPKPQRTDAVIGILPNGLQCARVRMTHEKGTDVSLGSFVLIDAFENDYEQAVVISNDSDLAVPISYVKDKIHKPIWILHPCRPDTPARRGVRPGVTIRAAATGSKSITPQALAACQFPTTLTDANGTIFKPPRW